jgi:hypothetical protein
MECLSLNMLLDGVDIMAAIRMDSSDERDYEKLRDVVGYAGPDQAVRQAIQMCWMLLPVKRRSLPAVEAEITRIVKRALANLKDDMESLSSGGIPGAP